MNVITLTRSSTRIWTHVEPVNMDMKALEDILNSRRYSLDFDEQKNLWIIKDSDHTIIGTFQEVQMTADGHEDTEFSWHEE